MALWSQKTTNERDDWRKPFFWLKIRVIKGNVKKKFYTKLNRRKKSVIKSPLGCIYVNKLKPNEAATQRQTKQQQQQQQKQRQHNDSFEEYQAQFGWIAKECSRIGCLKAHTFIDTFKLFGGQLVMWFNLISMRIISMFAMFCLYWIISLAICFGVWLRCALPCLARCWACEAVLP